MRPRISELLRRQVWRRAGGRCEYCQLSQEGQEATFHIDHAVPLSSGGTTDLGNLALACVSCSLRKGARSDAPIPDTNATDGEVRRAPLFDPRRHRWEEHFQWNGTRLEACSEIGAATITALDLNRPLILGIRGEERFLGRHPPPDQRSEPKA